MATDPPARGTPDPLIAQRRQKLATQVRDPYPDGFSPTHSIVEVLAAWDESGELKSCRVAGRLTRFSSFGGGTFADIDSDGARLQLLLSRKVMGAEEYARALEWADVGDIVAASGDVFATRTGQATVRVEDLSLLGKALRPLPEKFHGLRDVETRYRYRHLDLIANPSSREILRARSQVVREVRAYLDNQGFHEVETPALQPIYGGAAAQPFTTHYNALNRTFYLRISDELSRTGEGGGPEFLPAQDLAQRVRRFAGPALGRLLGSPTNVNLDNDFLLFQLASLRSQDIDLYVLAVRLCLLSLNRWLDRPADRKLILVDEAWSLLQDESGARFLLDLAKTARARGAMLLLVTQDSADFAANSLGKSILANCAASIIFRQHHAHSQVLGEMFNLDRALAARIGSLGRGQALAALSGGQRVRIETFNHPW